MHPSDIGIITTIITIKIMIAFRHSSSINIGSHFCTVRTFDGMDGWMDPIYFSFVGARAGSQEKKEE